MYQLYIHDYMSIHTAPTDKSYREWFRRSKDFSVEDKPRSGQPKKFEDKELEALEAYSKKIRVKRNRNLQNYWG